jgi:hypothetical protein
LIHRAPEVLTFALDGDEDLIQMPRVAEATLSTLESARVLWAELDAPQADGFIRDRDAALREEILNISKAQTETMIELDGVANDFGRKSISAVAQRVAFHLAKSARQGLNLTVPFSSSSFTRSRRAPLEAERNEDAFLVGCQNGRERERVLGIRADVDRRVARAQNVR